MSSCTIIVSHYESLGFVSAFCRQVKKYEHPEISTCIIIIDQSHDETNAKLHRITSEFENITIFKTEPLYSGYGIDHLMRYADIKTDYIAAFHIDAFPIHKNYLYLCIKLIEEYNLSFVGQLQFIADGKASIYPPNPFFAMAQCFNVARTETYKEMSLQAGFTRFHNRKQSVLTFENNDWNNWAKDDYDSKGSDDDTVAFYWESKYRDTDKLGLAISGFIQPNFGRIIDDLVFHFCSARESIGVIETMPELYKEYTRRINEGYSDELIEEMVSLAKNNKPNGTEILSRNLWDGELKKCIPIPDELNKIIEELKNN